MIRLRNTEEAHAWALFMANSLPHVSMMVCRNEKGETDEGMRIEWAASAADQVVLELRKRLP